MGARHSLDKQSESLNSPRSSFPTSFRVQASACSEFRVQASACSGLRRHGHCSSPPPCSEIRDFIVIKAGTRPDPLQFGPGTAFPEHLGISLHRTLCRAAPLYVPVALPLAIEDSVQAPSISSARPVL